MKFNYGNEGLCQDTRGLLGIGINDSSTYSNADIARSGNNWYRRAVNWVWESVGDWEYDDTNLSTLPVATVDLVDGQPDYELPSSAQKIDRVEIKDNEGTWHLLLPITKEQVEDEAITEKFGDDGLPEYYDMVGRSVILYPSPATANITASGGLKIYVSRDIDEFNATATTREPGFANNFHRIISIGSALDFANAKGMTDKITIFNGQLADIKKEMQEFYSRRHEKDFKLHIRPSQENFI